jgi:hypothetical protein
MKNKLYNDSLYTFCCQNNTYNTELMLKTFKELDVLYEEGSFFNFAISKNNIEICKALLDYFENKQFPIKDAKYEEGKNKLKEILENATDSIELSSEMKHELSPYLDFEGDLDSRLQEFNKVENSDYQLWINSLQTENRISETAALKCSGETEPIYSIQELSDVS